MTLADRFFPVAETEEEKKKRELGLTPSKIAGEKVKAKKTLADRFFPIKEEPVVKEEPKKESIFEKIKKKATEIFSGVGKKKIEEQISKEVPQPDITQAKPLKQNIIDYQIEKTKSEEAGTSAQLIGKKKGKVADEILRLEEKKTSTEKIDWRDELYDILIKNPEKRIAPFGDIFKIPEVHKLAVASERLMNGNATQEDAEILQQWLEQEQRDKTTSAKIISGIVGSLQFGAEMYLTSGTYAVGKTAAKKGLKYLMTKAGKEAAEKTLNKFGYKVAAGIVGETVRTIVKAPIKVTKGALENQLTSNIEVIAGVTDTKETVGKSITKAFLADWVENVSERGGDAMGIAFRGVSNKIKSRLLKNGIYKMITRLVPNKASVVAKYFQKAGYDGFLFEFLEERIGQVTNGLLYKLGLGNEEFKMLSKEDLLVEVTTLSVPGIISKVSDVVSSKMENIDPGVIKLTPDAARETVELSNLTGTETGDNIIKAAEEAEKVGAFVLIDPKGKEGNTSNTPDNNIVGVSISEGGLFAKKEPVVTEKEVVTAPEALETPIKTEEKKVTPEIEKITEVTKITPKVTTKDITTITQKDIDQTKNIKDVKSALTKVSKEFTDIKTQAEGVSQVAKELREGLNTKNIALLKRIYAKNKKFQEGDIETIRNSNSGILFNKVVEDIMIKYPKMDTQQAFDFAMELPTKADEVTTKFKDLQTLKDKKKILDKYLETLTKKQAEFTKKKELQKEDKNYKEWTQALEAQENVAKLITEKERTEAAKKPVAETTGKKKLSRFAAKVLDQLINVTESDITYNQMIIVEDAAKAAEFVTQQPEVALKIAKGLELPPSDITGTAISVAVAQKALDAGNYELYSKLTTSLSLRLTREGQEIVAARGRMDIDNPEFFMRKLLDARATIALKGKQWRFDVKKEIKQQVKQIKDKIDTVVSQKIGSAQKLIDSLTCK